MLPSHMALQNVAIVEHLSAYFFYFCLKKIINKVDP